MIPIFTRSLIPQNNAVVKPDRTPTSDLFFLLKAHHDRTGGDSGLIEKIENGIKASGAAQATAYQLSMDVSEVTAGAGSGVRLANLQPSQIMEVFNGSGGTIAVYPPAGGKIDTRATNAAYPLANGRLQRFRCYTSVNGAASFRSLAALGNTGTTSDPLLAQSLGLLLVPPGTQSVALPNLGWMVGVGFASLWAGTAGSLSTPDTCWIFRFDPATLAILAQINAGSWPTNEIRSITTRPEGMWFIDKAAGRLLMVDPATNTIVCIVTGFGTPAYSLCADNNYLYPADPGHCYQIDPVLALTLAKAGSGIIAKEQCMVKPAVALGATDTHVSAWDGGPNIYIPDISPDNKIFRIDIPTFTLAQILSTAAGGAWRIYPDGRRVWFSEISAQSIAYFKQNPTGAPSSGARWNLPATTGPADLKRVRDELYVAGSTLPNADGTNGALLVFDIEAANGTTPTPKKVITFPGCEHLPSMAQYGDDMFAMTSADSLGISTMFRVAIDDYSLI